METPRHGTVYFVGAGPGVPDLITVRGRDIITQADLVLYADSLVQESVAHLACKPDAQIVGSSGLHLKQIVALMVECTRAGGIVARVQTGDPSLYGTTHEQMRALDEHGVAYEMVPGVTAAFAAAARLGVELTVPEVVQTVILSRVAGRTPVPETEALRSLAAHGASLCLYLSISQIETLVAELLAGGVYTPDTPVAVAHMITWPGESIITGTLADIAAKVQVAGYQRHAVILVTPTLDPLLQRNSRLYDSRFTHGFRTAEVSGTAHTTATAPQPQAVVIAITRQGSKLAAHLAHELNAVPVVPTRFLPDVQADVVCHTYHDAIAAEIRRRWGQHRHIILIMASGVAVRAIAPLLTHKASDPAVVCLDEAGRSVIPLLGGHQAGANELAHRIAAITGGHAAITTASDVQHKPALDLLGKDAGWRIDPASALTHASACLVNGDLMGIYVDPALPTMRDQIATWLPQTDSFRFVEVLEELHHSSYAAALIISHQRLTVHHHHLLHKSVLYRPPVLVVGIGCQRGVTAGELRTALETTLYESGLAMQSVAALATVDIKAEEPGLQALSHVLALPLRIVERERLAVLDHGDFSPSAAQERLNLPGIAEPCAVVVAGSHTLLVPKQRFEHCTIAIALAASGEATHASQRTGTVSLISIGPGDSQQMTSAARAALAAAEVVIGYQSYIDQIRPLLSPHQESIARPMQSEMERAQQAIDLAAVGRRVALISSGDIGMYAMAGPVFELLHQHSGPSPQVQVFPGVSAFQAAAARVGAAINHDLCIISLSDLLTPWEVIERRLWAAAEGDFVVALYNPRSKGRDWQLARACEILRTNRLPETPAVLARNVMRPDEQIIRTTLAGLDPAQADMLTVVLVGNSQSYWSGEILVTPRGYTAQREDAGATTPESDEITTPQATYPINLSQMHAMPVVVVGGGQVGERKVRGLLAVGVRVTLISPDATPQLREWASTAQIEWQQRPYQSDDLSGCPLLVFAATSERETNRQVAHDAAARGLLCNVADAPQEGTFHLPALYREAGLVVAVSTGGVNPGRARQVRDRLADLLERPHSDG